jgi:exonuclease III
MKIIAWNCRGLGNASAVRGLLRCHKAEEADILFLSETKLDEKRMSVIKKKLGVENLEVVDCEGKGGGLAVLWRRGISVVLKSKSKNHIDMEVLETGGQTWRFTGIYGDPDLKYKTWELMEWLQDQDNEQLPWMCVGDFNEVLFHHEKEGGVPRAQSCLDRFKGALEVCDLDDLGFTGDIFTWRNKHTTGDTHIRERLDRAVANAGWRLKFLLAHVKNGDPYHSDHRPVVVSTEMIQRSGRGGNEFKFEASW